MKKTSLSGLVFIAATLVLPLAVIYSFLTMPLTDDVRVFIGAAHQAALTGLPFPLNIDSAWELKPLGNRALWYAITKISDFASPLVGTYGIQFIALIFAAVSSSLLTMQIKKYLQGNPDLIYIVVFLALLTPYNLFLMQAEWWALVFAYVVLYLLLKETPTSLIFAGILSVFIAFLKLSTLLLVPAIFVAYLLIAGYSRKETIKNTVLYFTGLVTGSFIALFWLLSLPNALPDIFFSINVAHASRGVVFSSFDGIVYLIYYGFQQIVSLPILAAGLLCCLGMTCICIMLWINAGNQRKEAALHMVLFLSLWIFPIISVFIQGEFFAYQYMVLALPCVVSIVLLGNLLTENQRGWMYLAIIASIAAFWLLHCSVWSDNYPAQEAFWNKIDNDTAMLNEKYQLSGQPSLLYLTSADAPYWFDVPGACRQTGSLPIMYNMTGVKEYNETVNCIKNYQGEYVIALHEMGSTLPVVTGQVVAEEMPGKYLPNYTEVEQTQNWDIYRRSVS
jgi:hypothetical protein